MATTVPPVARRLGLATLAAMAANAVVALVAEAFDTDGIGTGLSPVEYLPATLIGVLIGAAGWALIARKAPRALRIVVPAVLVLTWIPDVMQLNAGATAANVAGLMIMHIMVTTAVVVTMRVPAARTSTPALQPQR